MLKISPTPKLRKVAQRVVWFKSPQEALEDPYTFMAHVMTYGTFEDVSTVKKSIGLEPFKEALDHMPPGIIDEKSWYYWNTLFDRYPIPPLPERIFS